MWIYVLNFILILLYGFLFKNKKLFVTLAAVQIFLILALRAPTLGVDLDNYSGGYEYIAGLDFRDMLSRLHLVKVADLIYPYSFESGYVVFNWIVAALGFDFQGFLMVHAAITVAIVAVFIYRHSDDAPISFILFISLGFFTYLFGILRQTLAMAVFLMAIPCIKKRQPIRYLLWCLLAFTVHRAAILVVPLYFVYNLKMTKRRYVGLCAALGGLLAVSPLLAEYVLAPILELLGKSRYQLSFSLNNYILLMAGFAVLILIFTSFEDFFEKNLDNSFLCWCFLWAFAIEIMGLYNDVIARAMQIPYIAIIALIPNILKRYKHSGFSTAGRIALVGLTFVFMIMQTAGSVIDPYQTFFA